MGTYSDKQILLSLKKRDNKIVSYIAKKYLPMIQHLMRELEGGDENAEDIFQEALIIIIRKVDANELVLKAKFSTYLYAVCKNLYAYRKKKEEVAERYVLSQDSDEVEEENFSENYDYEIQLKMYKHYFGKLGPSCQDVLNMHWKEMPMKEIAKTLDSTEGYVRKKKHDCKKRLINLIMTNPDRL